VTERDALEGVDNQIELLCNATSTPNGYLALIDRREKTNNNEDDEDERFSDYQVWLARQKIIVLTFALKTAKEKMATLQNWDTCCKEATAAAIQLGIKVATNSRTVRNWYHDFRVARKIKIQTLPGKHNLPPFLQQNNDVVTSMQEYGREHLHELSVELMAEYLHSIVLPKMVEEATGVKIGDAAYDEHLKEVMKQYGLTCICIRTVCNWMSILGFKYCQRKKGYYVDGHEKPATVEYRRKFVQRYLKYERRAHRWIQITLEESKKLEREEIIPVSSGYYYTDELQNEMVEYHVDICHLFQDRMNERTKFGGNLSVRLAKEEKPLLMFGHDESIFKQYLLTGKAWIGPNGEKAISPKDEGQGVMISAFQSRNDGFGMDRT
jgi:predicted HTH domain antitoxin